MESNNSIGKEKIHQFKYSKKWDKKETNGIRVDKHTRVISADACYVHESTPDRPT